MRLLRFLDFELLAHVIMGESHRISREKVFKAAIILIVLLIIIQLTVSSVFYEKYQSFILLMSPMSMKKSAATRLFSSNSTKSYDNIKDFIAGGHLRNLNHVQKARMETEHDKTDASLMQGNATAIEPCPQIPPNLNERVPVLKDLLSFDQLHNMLPTVSPGGRWKPKDCLARNKVAIIIPYRNREAHLKIFLRHMHPFLQKQQLDYGIYVIELAEPTRFNRAMLMNIGFVESLKLYDYQCFIFHDVDLLPEDERNIYSCPEQPRHMSAAVDVLNYKLPYKTIFGGVSALTKEQMENVNGLSNKFFGWGGEDDDFYNRIVNRHYQIIRYPITIARYKMLSHAKDKASPERMQLLYTGKKRFGTDGLNSLLYVLKSVELKPLYTWVYVEIDENKVRKS